MTRIKTPAKTRKGRAHRHVLRTETAPPNPAPPGQIGGQYKPLSQPDIDKIYHSALDLLERLGLGETPPRLRDDLIKAGAVERDGRICLPRTLVEWAIDSAAKTFIFHGRDENRSIEVGGKRVYFGTGGAAVQVLDIDTHHYRPATLQDLHDFTRLQDSLTNISWFTRCCIATDVPDPFVLDVNTAYALMKNTTKPVATAFTLAEHVAPIVGLFDTVAGGAGKFAKRPFVKAHISPVISPMRWGEDAVDVVYECIAHNIPISNITAAQSGATAPAPIAGFLAQSLAETLASLVMVNVIKPAHPMIFSNWPLVIDLRTGAFSGGGAEAALMNAASAQVSNWLGLPSGVACSMSDAKALDAQYGQEKAMTSLAAALAGGNLIYESSGMTASLLGASLEAFVIDDEMHAANYRILRGVEVNDDTLCYDAICSAVLNDGHFLGAQTTIDSMERDYLYPGLMDRQTPQGWFEGGELDLWQRARVRAQAILDTHHPQYLTAEMDAALRADFPIV